MTVSDSQRPRTPIPLAQGANKTNLTPPGLLKILQRTGKAIRDDGHWFADPAIVEEIAKARQVLGLSQGKRASA
jgi:hypothetical protein